MKKLFLVMAAGLLLASCSKKEGLTSVQPQGSANVNVHVDEFSISVDTIPNRDEIPTVVKAITLAFYNTDDGTEQYKQTQFKNDASTYTTFGEFNLSLPMGSYTMVVLGYGTIEGCELVLTSPIAATFTGGHASETFAATQTVNVVTTDDVNISATLHRIVSKLQVISTDGKTANASRMQMTFSGGSRSFSPTTGLATDNSGIVNTVNIGAAVGAHSTSTTYLFLATDEQTMTVTLDVLDSSEESISHKVVTNVPLQRNRCTKLTGSVYTAGGSTNFTVSTDWLDETVIPF